MTSRMFGNRFSFKQRRHDLTFYQALNHSELGRNTILW